VTDLGRNDLGLSWPGGSLQVVSPASDLKFNRDRRDHECRLPPCPGRRASLSSPKSRATAAGIASCLSLWAALRLTASRVGELSLSEAQAGRCRRAGRPGALAGSAGLWCRRPTLSDSSSSCRSRSRSEQAARGPGLRVRPRLRPMSCSEWAIPLSGCSPIHAAGAASVSDPMRLSTVCARAPAHAAPRRGLTRAALSYRH
jgi:hypothetical protein